MALLKSLPGNRPAGSSYWIVDSYSYDAATDKTTINYAGWESEEVHDKLFPAADDRFSIIVDGTVTGVQQCEDIAKADDQKLKQAQAT